MKGEVRGQWLIIRALPPGAPSSRFNAQLQRRIRRGWYWMWVCAGASGVAATLSIAAVLGGYWPPFTTLALALDAAAFGILYAIIRVNRQTLQALLEIRLRQGRR